MPAVHGGVNRKACMWCEGIRAWWWDAGGAKGSNKYWELMLPEASATQRYSCRPQDIRTSRRLPLLIKRLATWFRGVIVELLRSMLEECVPSMALAEVASTRTAGGDRSLGLLQAMLNEERSEHAGVQSRDAVRRVRHTSRNTPYHAAGCVVLAAGLHQQAMVAGNLTTTINHMSRQHTAAQASAIITAVTNTSQQRRSISVPYARCCQLQSHGGARTPCGL